MLPVNLNLTSVSVMTSVSTAVEQFVSLGGWELKVVSMKSV